MHVQYAACSMPCMYHVHACTVHTYKTICIHTYNTVEGVHTYTYIHAIRTSIHVCKINVCNVLMAPHLQLNYQWLPQHYHIDMVCLSTFEIREKIKGLTEYTASDKMLVENDLCTISIVACMKEDQSATDSAMCLWKVESQLHNFTGMCVCVCVCVCVCLCACIICVSVYV